MVAVGVKRIEIACPMPKPLLVAIHLSGGWNLCFSFPFTAAKTSEKPADAC